MAKIFVSYSRKDIEFAKRLTAELKKCELDFWIDWEGIPPTVDWWREIEKGIEEADVFLFLISPDSSASKVCGQEIDTAVKNAKRIIPLVVRDIKGDEAPKQLSHLNWIFFRQSDDFEAAFQKLLTGIHTDYEWVQQHRWLQVRALDWQRDNKDNSSLLRGKDLQEVEYQLTTNSSKEPHPTDLQRQFVFESRKVVDRQRRIVTSISATGFVAMAVLTVFAFIQLNTSRAQQLGFQAEVALADHNANTAMLYAYQSNLIHKNKAADQVLSQVMYENFPLGRAIYTGPSDIRDVAWSQDGQLALVSVDNTIYLWSTNLNQPPRILKAGAASARSIAWSPTGQLASGLVDGTVVIWDLSTGQPAQTLKASSDLVSIDVAWLKNGQLTSVSNNGEVIIWNVETGEAAKSLTLQDFDYRNTRVAWSQDGKLASGLSDGNVIIWDLNTGQPAQILKGHSAGIWDVAWSPNGQLASASFDYTIIVWDLSSGKPAKTLKGHTFSVNGIDWSKDGQLASASGDKTVIIWNLETGQPAQILKGHSGFVNYVAWSPTGKLASISADNTMIVWDVNTIPPAQTLNSPSAPTSIAWSPKGQLASGSHDGTIIIWDLESAQPVQTLKGHTKWIRGIAWSANGKLASASVEPEESSPYESRVIVWDPNTGLPIKTLKVDSAVESVAWSPDGKLATGSDDGRIIIWNLDTGQPAQTLKASSSVNSVAWSALGRLASGSTDGTVTIWNLENGQPVQTLKGHKGSVSSVAWSPNGQLASGSEDGSDGVHGTVVIWNLNTGRAAQTLTASSGVNSIAWSSTGQLASASWLVSLDSTSLATTSGIGVSEIIIWDLHSNKPSRTLTGHTAKISSLAWSPNGQLASASWDLTIKITRRDLVKGELCGYIYGNMLPEQWLNTQGALYIYQPACLDLYDPSAAIGTNKIFQDSFAEFQNMGFPKIIAQVVTYVIVATAVPIVTWLNPSALNASINPLDLLLITWKGRFILLITYIVVTVLVIFLLKGFYKSAAWVWRQVRKQKTIPATHVSQSLSEQSHS